MIPDHADIVFSGKFFQVHHWNQEMFDGSVGLFERVTRNGWCAVLPIVGDKIVIARQEQPHRGEYLGFIGGMMDDGEQPETTAIRELREEAGMEATQCVFLYKQKVGLGVDAYRHYYLARWCQIVADQRLDGGEKIQLEYLSFEDFVDHVVSEKTYGDHAFREWLLYQHYTDGGWEGVKNLFFW